MQLEPVLFFCPKTLSPYAILPRSDFCSTHVPGARFFAIYFFSKRIKRKLVEPHNIINTTKNWEPNDSKLVQICSTHVPGAKVCYFIFSKRLQRKHVKIRKNWESKKKQSFPSLYKFAARMFLEQDSLLFFFQSDFRKNLLINTKLQTRTKIESRTKTKFSKFVQKFIMLQGTLH